MNGTAADAETCIEYVTDRIGAFLDHVRAGPVESTCVQCGAHHVRGATFCAGFHDNDTLASFGESSSHRRAGCTRADDDYVHFLLGQRHAHALHWVGGMMCAI